MKTAIVTFIITAVIVVACSSDSRHRPLRERIPPPNRKQYEHIRDAVDWHNPKLIIHAKGVEIVGVTRSWPGVPVDSLPKLLEDLPKSAWPYGLVVEASEAGLRNPGDDPYIRANRERLIRLLEALGIKVELWPSA